MPAALTGSVDVFGSRYPGYRLWFIGIAIVLAMAGWLVVTRTRVGALVRAIVDDRGMVSCMGCNPKAIMVGVLTVSGALAGLAGALGSPILGPGPSMAHHVMIMSLVIVALGILAVSVVVLTGYAGLPTLGQVAPYAVGAYLTYRLTLADLTVGPLQLVIVAASGAVFNAVLGLAVTRTRGPGFLMVTLALVLLAVTIGGRTSVVGSLCGVAIAVLLRDQLPAEIGVTGAGPTILGAAFVVSVYVLPKGLSGLRPKYRLRAR